MCCRGHVSVVVSLVLVALYLPGFCLCLFVCYVFFAAICVSSMNCLLVGSCLSQFFAAWLCYVCVSLLALLLLVALLMLLMFVLCIVAYLSLFLSWFNNKQAILYGLCLLVCCRLLSSTTSAMAVTAR